MSNILEFTLKLRDQMSSGIAGAAANVNRQFDSMNRSTRPVIRSLQEIQSQIRACQQTIRISTDVSQVRSASAELRRLQAEERGFNRRGISGVGAGGGGIMGMASMAGRIPQMLAASAVVGYGADSFQEAIEFRRKQAAINFGTDGQGANAVKQIDAITEKLGINYKASIAGFRTLSGSLKGVELQKQLDIFKGVSKAVSAMGLSADDAQGTFLALGQIASKGTVSAEELRGQIGERIPGAFSIAAKAMGVTEQALGKMMQKGEIASKDFLPRFAKQLDRTFGDAAMSNSKGPAAQMERLANAMFRLQVVVGEQLIPVMIPFMEKYLIPATNWMNKHGEAIIKTIMAIEKVANFGVVGLKYMMDKTTEAKERSGQLISAEAAAKSVENFKNIIAKGVTDSDLLATFEKAGKMHGDIYQNSLLMGFVNIGKWMDKFFNTNIYSQFASGKLKKLGLYTDSSTSGDTVTPYAGATASGGAKKSVKDGIDSITGGGAKNIYINLGKFQDQLNINTMTFKEGVNEMEQMIENSLLRILNSANTKTN